MKQGKWEIYWQKRAVKAEAVLTRLAMLAGANNDGTSDKIISDYFRSVAAGEVKDTPLDGDSRRE